MARQLIKYGIDLTGRSRDNLVVNEIHVREDLANRIIMPDAGAFYAESMVVTHQGTTLRKGTDWKVAEGHEDGITRSGKQVNFFVVLLNNDILDQVELTYQAYGDDGAIINNVMREYLLSIINNDYNVSFKDIVNLPTGFNPQEHYHSIAEVNGWKPILLSLEAIREAILAQRGTNLYKIFSMIADVKTFVEEEVEKVRAIQGDTFKIDALIKRLSDKVDQGMDQIEDTVNRLIANSELSVQMERLRKTLSDKMDAELTSLRLEDGQLKQNIDDLKRDLPTQILSRTNNLYISQDTLTQSIANFINRTDLENALSIYATADALANITTQITDKVTTDVYLSGITQASQTAMWNRIVDKPNIIQLHPELDNTRHLNSYVGFDHYGIHPQHHSLNNGKSLGYPYPAVNGDNNATSYPGQLVCYPHGNGSMQEYSYLYRGKYYKHIRIFEAGNWTNWHELTQGMKGFLDPTTDKINAIQNRTDMGYYLIRRTNNILTTIHSSWPRFSHITLPLLEGGRLDVKETGANLMMELYTNNGLLVASRYKGINNEWSSWVDRTRIHYNNIDKPRILLPRGIFSATPHNQFRRGVFGERWMVNNNGTVTITGNAVFAFRTDRLGVYGPTEAMASSPVGLFYKGHNRVVVWNKKTDNNRILPSFNKWNGYSNEANLNLAVLPIQLPKVLRERTIRIIDTNVEIDGFPTTIYRGSAVQAQQNRFKVSTRADSSNRPVDDQSATIRSIWTLSGNTGNFTGYELFARVLNKHSLNLPQEQETSGLVVGIGSRGHVMVTDHLYLLTYKMTLQITGTTEYQNVDKDTIAEESAVQNGLVNLNLGRGSLMDNPSATMVNNRPFLGYVL